MLADMSVFEKLKGLSVGHNTAVRARNVSAFSIPSDIFLLREDWVKASFFHSSSV